MLERTVRNFRIVEPIGSGGMGMIYRAVQTTLDRPVAIKELHPHLAKDEDFIRRFEREAKSAASLSHENIVGVIDFGREGDSYFLALEFVDGIDMKGLLVPGEPLPPPVALSIAADVLRGLEHAHARGVVHRDIKPANVMIAKDGTAKVADFSIARIMEASVLTQTGETIGTPAYMSPEQASESKAIDGRGDLFSVGVMLYEALAGKRPFPGETFAAVVTQLLTMTPKPLSEANPLVPASVSAIVARAMEKEPSKRFADAATMSKAIADAAAATQMPLGRDVVRDFVADPKEASKRWRAALTDPSQSLVARRTKATRVLKRGVAGGAAIAGAAALVFAGWWLGSGNHSPSSAESTPPALAMVATATPTVIATPVVIASTVPPVNRARHSKPTPTPATAAAAATEPVSVAATATATAAATATVPALAPSIISDPEASDGELKLTVHPWADVYLDGTGEDEKQGTTPIARPIHVAPGKHVLTLRSPGFDDYVETIDFRAGVPVIRDVTLTKHAVP